MATHYSPRQLLAGRSQRWLGVLVWLLLLYVGQVGQGGEPGALDTPALETRIRQASRSKVYRPATTVELRAAERLFVRTFRGDEPIDILRDAWAELNFEIEEHGSGDQRIWLLRESARHETGRGFYAFRFHDAIPCALEAPHSFADRNTRRLTAQLFLETQCAAAAWNTIHRKIVDAAHTKSSFLNAFTLAFLRVHGEEALICQLHGFAREKRTTGAGRTSDMIVSTGTNSPDSWLRDTVSQFRKMSPETSIKLYPDEVSELGATTNWQGRLIREAGVGRFFHVELSAELRNALLNRSIQQSELFKILESALRTQRCGYADSTDYPENVGQH